MTGLSEGFSGFVAGFRPSPDQGRTLEQVLAPAARRSWWDADEPEPVDPDEKIANLLARGYTPGLTTRLSQQLGEVEGELEAEREKLTAGERRMAHIRRAHEAGRLNPWQMMEQLGGDFGDADRVRQLEHQAQSLRGQLADAAAVVAPQPQCDLDPVEGALSRARSAGHEAFREATRAAMAAAGQRPARQPEPRPFESGDGEAGEVTAAGPEITRSAGSCCGYCTEYGVSAPESVRLHASMMASQQ